jgi:cadmium resistance protein CadD (predicted permease)
MKYAREFVVNAVVGGLLVLLPIYLAVLVLLKGMQSVVACYGRLQRYSRTGCRARTSGRWW